jgi:hypothetical protein
LPDGSAVADLLPGVADQEVRRVGSPWGTGAAFFVFFVVAGVAVLLWWLIGTLL